MAEIDPRWAWEPYQPKDRDWDLKKAGHLLRRATFGATWDELQTALKDGYTTGKGMGLGLGGAKRLANEFSIESKPGEGTKVVIARWKLP